jgi:hypothetical protein
MIIRAIFYHKDDPQPVADIPVEVNNEQELAKAAERAFAEFARKHTGFRLLGGDVFVEFRPEATRYA